MRHRILLSLSILVSAAILISCNGIEHSANSATPLNANLGPETTYADGARRITIDELESLMKNGEAFVVDVRNQASYDAGHIPGSKLIPAGEIGNRLNELP